MRVDYLPRALQALEEAPESGLKGPLPATRELCDDSGMVVRNISQAKAELSALIEAVRRGQEVVLTKAGKPVARLVVYRGPVRPRTPGSMAGQIWIAPDFDALPADLCKSFGMKQSRS